MLERVVRTVLRQGHGPSANVGHATTGLSGSRPERFRSTNSRQHVTSPPAHSSFSLRTENSLSLQE